MVHAAILLNFICVLSLFSLFSFRESIFLCYLESVSDFICRFVLGMVGFV